MKHGLSDTYSKEGPAAVTETPQGVVLEGVKNNMRNSQEIVCRADFSAIP